MGEALALPRGFKQDVLDVDEDGGFVCGPAQLDAVTPSNEEEKEEYDVPSASALSFSESSNNSPVDFSSLMGEKIDSKETTSTTFDHDEANVSVHRYLPEDPPLPARLPKYRPLSPYEDSDSILDFTDDIKKSIPPLPPQNKEDANTVKSANSSSTSALLEHFVGRVIGHSEFMDGVACPCCQQCLEDPARAAQSTLIEPHVAPLPTNRNMLSNTNRSLSLISAAESEDDNDDEEQLQLDVDIMRGVLREGVSYRIHRVLVEGLLHKKGTGRDWLGSRGWKARWARLALGRIEGYGDVAVPLLCISWYPSSVVNSTVIVLDSTVVLAVDSTNKEKWNTHRFEVRHASSRKNSSLPVTRTFSAASRKARDAWVYAISQALFSYEKEKAEARKQNPGVNYRPQSPLRPDRDRSKSPTRNFDEVWMGDRFTTVDRPPSPVRRTGQIAPPPPHRCNLASPPRPVRSPTATRKGSILRAPKISTRSVSA